MRHALAQQAMPQVEAAGPMRTAAGSLAEKRRSMERRFLLQQRQQELLRRNELQRKRSSLYTGSIADLIEPRETGAMFNNHGLSSTEQLQSSELSACSFHTDKRDSDSFSSDCSKAAAAVNWPAQQHHQQYQQQQNQHQHQQQQQLIIPRRLLLDAQPSTPQSQPVAVDNQQQPQRQVQFEQDRSSPNSSEERQSFDSLIFQPTTTTVSGPEDESLSSESCAFSLQPQQPQPQPQPLPRAQSRLQPLQQRPKQVAVPKAPLKPQPPPPLPSHARSNNRGLVDVDKGDDCWESATDYDDVNSEDDDVDQDTITLAPHPLAPVPPQAPPFSMTIDRQVVAVSLDDGTGRQGNRHQQNRTMELFPTTAGDNAASKRLKRQLRQIDQLSCSAAGGQQHRRVQSQQEKQLPQQLLCTSSSNCCGGCFRRGGGGGAAGKGGGKGGKGSGADGNSLESSLNLMTGTTVLSRPGSLPGINIDGLVAPRRLRCSHVQPKIEELDEDASFRPKNKQDKGGKKSVSFSASVQKDDDDSEGPIGFFTSDSDTSKANKMTFELVNTDTDVSEIDSDSKDYMSSKRAAQRDREVTSVVAPEAAQVSDAEIDVEPAVVLPTASQKTPPPPQPPKTVLAEQQEKDVENVNAVEMSESIAARPISPDSNIDMAIGQVFVANKANTKGQSITSSFKLTTDHQNKQHREKPEEVGDTESVASDRVFDAKAEMMANDSNTDSFRASSAMRKKSINVSLKQVKNLSTSSGKLSHKEDKGQRDYKQRDTESAGSNQKFDAGVELATDSYTESAKASSKKSKSIYGSLRRTTSHGKLQKSDSGLRDCTNSSSMGKLDPPGGSNCANSSIPQHRSQQLLLHHHNHHHHNHYQQSAQIPAGKSHLASSSTRSTGYSSWGAKQQNWQQSPVGSSDSRKAGATSGGTESSYVVFQHPPEVATAKRRSQARSPDDNEDDFGICLDEEETNKDACDNDNSNDSIAFSWVTAIGNESNAAGVVGCAAASRANSTKATALDMSLTLDSSSRTSSLQSSLKGGRNSTSTGRVTFNQLSTTEGKVTSIPPSSAQIASAATNARVGCVGKDPRVKAPAARDPAAVYSIAKTVCTKSVSNDPVTISGFNSTDSTESDQPCLMLEALSCAHKEDCNGCSANTCPSHSSPSSRRAPRAPTATALKNATASRLPAQRRPSSPSLPKPPTTAATAAAAVSAAAAADAVRDLLSHVEVCDPSEAAALTRALVRGLVCNVESLRSTLTAALMLLKDRTGCTRPLAQAIGTADTLDDLIRQVQNPERQQHKLKKPRINHHINRGDNCTMEKAAPVVSLQCHAMAHYVIGEQFVEPSLEQRTSLECRPSTTRVVRSESKSVGNLVADTKRQHRP